MKLFTKEILEGAKKYPLNSQENKEADKAVVWAKFFAPSGRYTVYVTEMEVEIKSQLGNWQMVEGTIFGYVVSPLGPDCDELGYVDLEEMTTVKFAFGLGIERDMGFSPCTLQEIMDGEKR